MLFIFAIYVKATTPQVQGACKHNALNGKQVHPHLYLGQYQMFYHICRRVSIGSPALLTKRLCKRHQMPTNEKHL
jgi:hypothetical protein